MRQIVIAGICFFLTLGCSAQTMTIKSVSLQPSDKTAVENPCLDLDGDTCALVKIKTDHLEGIEFTNPNQYIKTSYSDGTYSVYVPTAIRKLDFQHKDYMPVQIDMADFGYRRLKGGRTYMVTLEAVRMVDLKSTVVLKVEPKNSTVVFDKKSISMNSNGIYEIPVTLGLHSYSVGATNFQPQTNSFTIGKSEVKTLTVKLQPIMHEVLVGSNAFKARVYVDNMDYGGIGKKQIPQGMHNIRVQADGYLDMEQDVDITDTTGYLSFILKENKMVAHVHATPVTIFSSSSCVYKNNKRIKEWTNGATIMFMPGKYLLSDDNGRTKKIIVESEPIVIDLSPKSDRGINESERANYQNSQLPSYSSSKSNNNGNATYQQSENSHSARGYNGNGQKTQQNINSYSTHNYNGNVQRSQHSNTNYHFRRSNRSKSQPNMPNSRNTTSKISWRRGR